MPETVPQPERAGAVGSTRIVGLRRCSCGKKPRVSFEDYVWIECPDGDDGCQDSIWATTPERAKELWNEPNEAVR